MPFNTLFTIFVVVIAFCFFAGQRRALKLRSDGSSLHSLPFYHGTWLIIVGVLPALIILLIWSLVESSIIRAVILSELPVNLMLVSAAEKSLLFSEIANLANGQTLSPNAEQLAPLADRYNLLESLSGKLKLGLALIISVIGFGLGWLRLKPDFRARNRFESTVRIILMSCASLAVLTTVGIVFSVLFEAMRFFDTVSIFEFIFGTH